MGLRLTEPTDAELRRVRSAAAGDTLTYGPVGISSPAGVAPSGYHRDHWVRSLGSGPQVWKRGCDALTAWQVHRGAGLVVCADSPPTVGLDIAMSAPLPIGHIEAVCRVVAIEDSPDRFEFAYGTLPNHPEQGEESFVLTRRDDDVRFEITAVWRPRHLLAKALPPIARHLQKSATQRYFTAMLRAVSPP